MTCCIDGETPLLDVRRLRRCARGALAPLPPTRSRRATTFLDVSQRRRGGLVEHDVVVQQVVARLEDRLRDGGEVGEGRELGAQRGGT